MVAQPNRETYYEVEVEDQLRRVYTPQVSRKLSVLPDSSASERRSPSPPIVPTPPEEMPMRRLIWRAIKRTLNYWFPPDPPNVIAIIRMPEKFYCARCGTVRESKYCPACGANVERQFKKMMLKMATYVVEGTEDRRQEIARSVQEQVEIRAEMAEAIRQRVEAKLAMLERTYVMQIAQQKKRIDRLLQAGRSQLLPSPDASVFNAGEGVKRLA